MTEAWLSSLKTETPERGYELAIKLARMGIKSTQPSDEVRDRLRSAYEQDTTQLIAISQVIATHFQTIAAANDYWRGRQAFLVCGMGEGASKGCAFLLRAARRFAGGGSLTVQSSFFARNTRAAPGGKFSIRPATANPRRW
jgi:hypothetical protein